MDKRKLEADKKLIQVLFDIDPLDWNRRDNGELVFLNQSGQKFTYSPEELNQLSDIALAEKEKPEKKPASKSKSEPKTGLNPDIKTDPDLKTGPEDEVQPEI